MKKTTVKIYCDLCENEMFGAHETKMQVIFTTEQTEGRSAPNHFHMTEIHVCEDCEKKALEGNYIFASGAQGHNKYWFKDIPKK